MVALVVSARRGSRGRGLAYDAVPTDLHPSSSTPATASAALAGARLYLCTDARTRQGDFAQFVRAAYTGGVDVVQLRDKHLEARAELEVLATLETEARRAGKLFAVNDRADIAALGGADVLHVGQDDLRPAQARRVASDAAVGLSTHEQTQVSAALLDDDVDYFCVGPVWATPTKPERPAVGLDLVRAAAARTAGSPTGKPWFAIGGIGLDTIDAVLDAGARRDVVVRAITAAGDPRAAARALRDRLPD